MFSQRRKRYRNVVWASVLTAIALLSLVLLLGYLGSFQDEPKEEVPVNEVVSVPKERKTTASNEEVEKKQTYYLVKYDNDIVRVYFSNQLGELTELEKTDIVYETLSPEDQETFLEGVKLENRDALNKLLMDYEG